MVAAALLGSASMAPAATVYWDGTSGSWVPATNWSTVSGANNPNPDASPSSADDVIFNLSTANDASTITLDAAQSVNSLTFNSTGPTALTSGLGTNALTLGSGGLTLSAGAGGVTLNAGIRLGASQTWTNHSSNLLLATSTITNAADLAPNTLTLGGTGNTQLNGIISNGGTTGTTALVKSGTGTLTIGTVSGVANTFSGGTTIDADSGTVIVTNAASAGLGTGAISIGAGSILQLNDSTRATNSTFANTITGTGTIKLYLVPNQTAAGIKVDNATGFAGLIHVATNGAGGSTGDKFGPSGGFSAPNASVQIDHGAQLYTASGGATFAAISLTGFGGSEGRGALRLDGPLVGNITLAGNASVGGAGAVSGNVTGTAPTGNVVSFFLGTPGQDNSSTFSGVLSDGSAGGKLSLVKRFGGTSTINGGAVSTYTGDTVVDRGTLLLNLNSLATPTNLINSGSRLVLGGGTLSVTGKSAAVASSQTFASTLLNSGNNVVTTTQGSGGTSVTLDLSAITRNAGAMFNISNSPDTTGLIVKTSGVNGASLPGAAAYFGAWATYQTSTSVRLLQLDSAGRLVQAPTSTTFVTTGGDVNTAYNLNGNKTLTGNITNYIWYQTAASVASLGNFNATLNGFISINNTAASISRAAGTGTVIIGTEREFVVNMASGNTLTISVPVVNNPGGASGISLTGSGSLVLNTAVSTYTGTTTVNSGTLTLGLANVINSASNLVINGGTVGIGTFNQSLAGVKIAGGGTITGTTGVLTSASAYDLQWSGTISAILAGNVGLNKTTERTVTLSGVNTFTGDVNINAGQLNVTTASNASALGNAANIVNLGDTSGVLSATLGFASSLTLANPLTVRAGSTGAKTISSTTALAIGELSGNLTLNDDLYVLTTSTGGIRLSGGSINLGGKTLYLTQGGTSATAFALAGTAVGTNGSITIVGAGTGTSVFSSASSTYGGGTILGGVGTVQVDASSVGGNASGPFGTGRVTLNGAALNAGVTADRSIANAVTIAENTTFATQANEKSLTLTGPVTLANGDRTLTVNLGNTVSGKSVVLSGAIGDNGQGLGLTKAGSGTLTLSAANTYTGPTSVSAGYLSLTHSSALAGTSFVSTTTTGGGGAVQLADGVIIAGKRISVSGYGINVRGGLQAAAGASAAWAGQVQIGSTDARIGAMANATLTLSGGIIDGAGTNFIVSADATNGKVVVSGTNTYSGQTQIVRGTLALGASNTLPAAAVLNVHSGGSVTDGAIFDLNGFDQQVGGITRGAVGGTATVTNSHADLGTLTVNPATDISYDSPITGNLKLVKDGAASQTLTGASTYTGGTLIKDGALKLEASNDRLLTTGTVTLGGIATTGKLVIGQTAAPGNQTLAGLLTTGLGGSVVGAATTGFSTLTLNISGTNVFGGTLGGAGTNENQLALTKSGEGTLTLAGTNTYAGVTSITSGVLQAGSSQALSSASAVILADAANATLDLNGQSSTIGSLAGGGATGGTVTLGAATLTTGADGTNTSYAGNITGAGNLVKTGAGTFTLSSAQAYTGTTTVSNGTLLVNGGLASSATTVASGATLGGTGTLTNALTIGAGGTLSPATATTAGTLTLGSLTLDAGSLLAFEFGGASDLIAVTTPSGLTINGGALNLYAAGGLAPLTDVGTYTLFTYGTAFGGDKNNLSVANSQAGKTYALNDTGNALQLVIGTATSSDWSGTAADGLWTSAGTGGNWTDAAAPVTLGAVVNFGLTPSAATTVTLDGAKTVGSIIFNNANAYTIGTNADAITLDNGIAAGAISVAAGSHLINAPLVLNGPANIVPAATTSLTFGGAISGAGKTLTFSGAGAVTLSAANTFGSAVLSAGTLNLGHDGAVGAGQFTISGGTLDAVGGARTLSGNNAVSITGDFAFTGTNDLNFGTGAVSLASTRTLTISARTLTFAGVVSGAGLTKAGPGTLVLSGSNTYTGATTLAGGTLIVQTLANGGVASNIGQSANTAANLVLGGGTLRYTGPTVSTDRALSLSAGTTSTIEVTEAASNLTLAGASAASTGALTKSGPGVLTFSGANGYTGATTINAGQLVLQGTSASSSYVIPAGTVLELNAGVTRDHPTTGFTGAGTLRKTGTGEVYWGTGAATFALGSGSLIDVQEGTFKGGSNNNEVWTNNLSDLNIASGALFAGVEANVKVNRLTGSGRLTTGYSGYLNLTIGVDNGSSTFDGTIENGSTAGNIVKAGTGAITLTGANTYTGSTKVSAGTLTLTADRTINAGAFTVGDQASATATLNLQGNLPMTGQSMSVGSAAGATGTVNHTAGTLSFTSGNAILIGNAAGGSTGIYHLDGGTISTFASASRGVMIGVNTGEAGNYINATFNLISGSLSNASGALMVVRGDNVSSYVNSSYNQTGGISTNGTLVIGGSGANGANSLAAFSVTGGTFSAAAFSSLSAGNGVSSTLTIGGTADVTLPAFPTTRGTGATATLNLDGGTLKPAAASAAYLGGLTNAFIKSGGAHFNTNAFDITVSQALLADSVSTGGGLTKSGNGTLTLSGANTYTGVTTVSGGTLALSGASNNNIAGSSGISVGNGATLSMAGLTTTAGTLTLAGGQTLTATGATATVTGTALNTAGNNTLSAASGGTLTLPRLNVFGTGNQFAGGGITSGGANKGLVIGSNGSGELTIAGGTFTSAGGSANADFIGNAANGFGTLTIAGGAYVNTADTGTLVLGGGVGAGSGTLTLSSGSATIHTLHLDATEKNATVNLDGGTLTVSNVTAGTGTGARTVNFNGGQFVAGAGLSFGTSLTLNVKTGGARFDTAGLSIAVNEALLADGASTGGGLTKSGNGTLALTGANTFTGQTTVSGGTLNLGNGGSTGSLYAPSVTNGNLAFGSSGAIVNNSALAYQFVGGDAYVNKTITGSGTLSVSGDRSVHFAHGTTITTTGAQTYSATATSGRYYGFNLTENASVALTSSGAISITGMLGTSNSNSGNLTLDTSAGNGNVTLNTAVGVANVDYGLGSLTVRAGTGAISLGGFSGYQAWGTANTIALTGGDVSSSVAMNDFATLTVTNTGTGTFSGVLSGNGSLTKAGSGTLTLGAFNTYGGGTTVGAGTLNIDVQGDQTNSAVGVNKVVAVSSGATLRLAQTDGLGYYGANPSSLVIAGTMTIAAGKHASIGAFGLTLDGGTLTAEGAGSGEGNYIFDGTVTTLANASASVINAPLVRLRNGSGGANQAVTFDVADGAASTDLAVSSVLANGNGANGLIKAGAGNLALSGNNTFSGGTTINGGTVTISSPSADNGGYTALGNGTVTVNSGATLVSASSWSTGNEWNGGNIGKLTLNAGATWTINTAGNTLRNGLELNGATINGSGENADWGGLFLRSTSVTVGGSAVSTIAVDTALNSGWTTFTVGEGSRLDYTGKIHNKIGDSAGLVKAGAGTMVLSGANTYSGGTTVNAGTLTVTGSYPTGGTTLNGGRLVNGAASGTSFSLGALALNGGELAATSAPASNLGNYQLRGDVSVGGSSMSTISADVRVIANEYRVFDVADVDGGSGVDLLVSGKLGHYNGVSGGSFVKAGAGTMRATGQVEVWNGTVNAGRLILEDAAVEGWWGGGLTTNAVAEFALASAKTSVYAVTGSGSVVKTGNGTLSLLGDNSYSGGTTIDAGTLRARRNTLGTGAVVVNNGGTLHADDQWVFCGVNGYSEAQRNVGTLTLNAGGTLYLDPTNGFANGITNLFLNGGAVTGGANDNAHAALFLFAGNEQITAGGGVTSTIGVSLGLNGNNNSITVESGSRLDLTQVLKRGAFDSAGRGGFVKNGAGTLVLSGANSYDGVTDITAGTLLAASGTALGAGGHAGETMSFVRDGATLALQGGISLDEHFHVWGAGVGGLGAVRSLSGNNTLSNAPGGGAGFALRSNTTVGVDAGTLTVSGFYEAGGSHGLTKVGDGTLVLNVLNTYTGGTTVNGGTLVLPGNGGYGRISGALTVNAGGTVATTGDGSGFGFYDQLTSLTINGGLVKADASTSHIWNLTGGITMTGGELQSNGGVSSDSANALQWNRTSLTTNASASSAVISGRVALRGDAGYTTWSITVADGAAAADLLVSAAITGGGVALAKSGEGRMVLSGANTYTGATVINGGTLAYQNTYASPSHAVASGAVLEFNTASGERDGAATTFTGAGTLRKTGAGGIIWGSGVATFALGSGALIDVQAGGFTGGSYGNDVWTDNRSDLNVAAGATFNTVEANVRLNKITGAGTILSGYGGAGYQNLTIGVDNGSSAFAGVIADANAAGNLVKAGSGTITLAGANTYSGVTTLAGGVLEVTSLADNGTASSLGVGTGDTNGDRTGILFQGGTLRYAGSTAQSTNRSIRLSTTGGGGTIDASGSTPEATVSFTRASMINWWENGGTRTLTLTGTNTGANTLTAGINDFGGNVTTMHVNKEGAGTWVLAGAGNYIGVTDIKAGMLIAASNGALGAGGHDGGTMSHIRDGATLALQGGISLDEHFHVWGAGVSGLGAIRSLSGDNALTNAPGGAAGFALRANTTVGVDAGTLTVSGFYEDQGSFGLTKVGNGTLALTVPSTYTGATSVTGGTLNAAAGALANTSGITVTGAALSAVDYPSSATLTLDASSTAVVSGANLNLAGAVTNEGSAASALNFSATSGTITLASLAGSGKTRFGRDAVITGGISSGAVTVVGALSADISGGTVSTGALTGAITGGTTTVSGVATISSVTAGTVNLNGATSSIATLTAGTINLGTTALTVQEGTFTGLLAGAQGSLIKTSNGTLTLSGANSFGGGTTVSAGTLVIGQAGSLGSGAVTVASGASLDLANFSVSNIITAANGASIINGPSTATVTTTGSQSVDTVLTGTGGLTKSDGGELTLTTPNFFTGGVSATTAGAVISAAHLADGSSSLGASALNDPTKLVLGNGATLEFTGTTATTTSRSFTVSGSAALAVDASAAALTFSSASIMALDPADPAPQLKLVANNAGVNRFEAQISADDLAAGRGISNLVIDGTGQWVLGGAANRFKGDVRMEVGGGATLGFEAGALGTGSTYASSVIEVGNGSKLAWTGSNNDDISGRLSVPAGATAKLDLGDNNVTFASAPSVGTGGSIEKQGTGTLKIAAAVNAPTLNVAITGGRLAVNGTLGNITLAQGATLGGSGTIGRATVASGAIVAPGNSPGLLNGTSMTLAGGAIFEWEVQNATSTSGYDRINLTGDLDLRGANPGSRVVFKVVSRLGSGDGNTVGDPLNFAPPGGAASIRTFQFGQVGGVLLNSGQNISDVFSFDVSQFTYSDGSSSNAGLWSINWDSGTGAITVTAVPEPSTYGLGLGALALAAAALRRRRRQAPQA